MTTSTQWQLARQAAERYASVLVPAILGPAARALVDWSTLRSGDLVVDVGCGSGAATFAAAERVGPEGRVIGVDINVGMLDVARSQAASRGAVIDWREQSAYALPVDDAGADAIIGAQLLQFLDDRPRGVAEMHRALKTGGRLFVSTWCGIGLNPYFGALVEAVREELGAETAAGLNAAFSLPSQDTLAALLDEAGFGEVRIVARRLDLELPPLTEFVPRHLAATPLAAAFAVAAPAIQQAVVRRVADALEPYAYHDGVRAPFTTHLASAIR